MAIISKKASPMQSLMPLGANPLKVLILCGAAAVQAMKHPDCRDIRREYRRMRRRLPVNGNEAVATSGTAGAKGNARAANAPGHDDQKEAGHTRREVSAPGGDVVPLPDNVLALILSMCCTELEAKKLAQKLGVEYQRVIARFSNMFDTTIEEIYIDHLDYERGNQVSSGLTGLYRACKIADVRVIAKQLAGKIDNDENSRAFRKECSVKGESEAFLACYRNLQGEYVWTIRQQVNGQWSKHGSLRLHQDDRVGWQRFVPVSRIIEPLHNVIQDQSWVASGELAKFPYTYIRVTDHTIRGEYGRLPRAGSKAVPPKDPRELK